MNTNNFSWDNTIINMVMFQCAINSHITPLLNLYSRPHSPFSLHDHHIHSTLLWFFCTVYITDYWLIFLSTDLNVVVAHSCTGGSSSILFLTHIVCMDPPSPSAPLHLAICPLVYDSQLMKNSCKYFIFSFTLFCLFLLNFL